MTADPEKDHFEIYVLSLLVAIFQFSGSTPGGIFPENLAEYILYFVATLFGN